MRWVPGGIAAAIIACFGGRAEAQPDAAPAPDAPDPVVVAPDAPPPTPLSPEPPREPTPADDTPAIDIHGFASQGGFISTANDYIGRSSRGTLELFEAGLNVTKQVTSELRGGIQLFARDFGRFDDTSPRIDWAFVDYRWRAWLGMRGGIIRMPFGLYNEFTDIDAARLPILMPPAVYPFRNRDVLLSHRGFALYGTHRTASAGELEYQTWLGTLSIPLNALRLSGATLESIDTRYVAGTQVFWHTPIDGLKLGGTWIRASIDFYLRLSQQNIDALIAAGAVPPDFDGGLVVSQRPNTWIIGSIEYIRGDLTLAAEYARAFQRQSTSLSAVIPTFETDRELMHAMTAYRLSPWLELGGYVSLLHADAGDRDGSEGAFPAPYYAFQRDLAVTVRFDVNPHWLWKIEAHAIDGVADLEPSLNPDPKRRWGLFLFRTTLTF